jgi:hypothetical protein
LYYRFVEKCTTGKTTEMDFSKSENDGKLGAWVMGEEIFDIREWRLQRIQGF